MQTRGIEKMVSVKDYFGLISLQVEIVLAVSKCMQCWGHCGPLLTKA